jgi:hypothetical protein
MPASLKLTTTGSACMNDSDRRDRHWHGRSRLVNRQVGLTKRPANWIGRRMAGAWSFHGSRLKVGLSDAILTHTTKRV